MGRSYRVTVRFNPEYDDEVIKLLEQYKDRNLSKVLREIIRNNLLSAPLSAKMSDTNHAPEIQTKQDKVIKWNIPTS